MKCVTLSGTNKDENWLHTKSNKWHIFESTKSLTQNTINDKFLCCFLLVGGIM